MGQENSKQVKQQGRHSIIKNVEVGNIDIKKIKVIKDLSEEYDDV